MLGDGLGVGHKLGYEGDAVLETLLPEERCHINSVAARAYGQGTRQGSPQNWM